MKRPSTLSRINRRRFLAVGGAALAMPAFVPAGALGLEDKPAPSNRITLGVIGWGMQGPSNTRAFLDQSDCQVVAACDLDQNHLADAAGTINEHYQNKDC